MMTNALNVVLIQIDSLNRHFLPIHGNRWIEAPNLTAFAERSAVFENHFTGSLPCMPARREIWTGTEEFWWREWGPLEPWDEPLAYLAGQRGVVSNLITDHYHLFEWGSHSYHNDFDGYVFIRGHEHDNWRTDPLGAVPEWAKVMVERRDAGAHVYLRNTQDFRTEDDFFAPQVMARAVDWLERNRDLERFFLHVDCFDVHEPFHIPEPYRSMYTDDDHRAYSPWPLYGRVDAGRGELSEAEVDWVRAQFAGKLTMVDNWFGRVLDVLDGSGLMERSCVIVTTDHGHFLGDHGWMGKPPAPLYHTLCHVPLFVWHPDGRHNGARISATTQTIDLHATVRDLLGAAPQSAAAAHGRSLLPLVFGVTDHHRDHAVYGYCSERIGITAGDWTLLRDHDSNVAPASWYTQQPEQMGWRGRGWLRRHDRSFELPKLEAGHFLPGVTTPVWKMPRHGPAPTEFFEPRRDLLFNNAADPEQERDLSRQHPEKVRELEDMLRAHATAIGAPEEQLRRLRL